MKELQPSVIQSCCREDRHWNNQVDIKSKATTKYLWRYIYYKGNAHGPAHRPCLYMFLSTWGRYGVITKNQNKRIIKDKGHVSGDDPMGRGEGKGEGDGMGKGSTDMKNLQRRSYLQYQG